MCNLTGLKLAILLTVLFVSSGFGLAYAQETSLADKFYGPETKALETFATEIATSAPKIIAAAVLLIIGLIVGKIVARVVEKTATRVLKKAGTEIISESKAVENTLGKINSARLIAATVKWFVYLFFIVAAINSLQLDQLTSALTSLWLWIPNLLAFVMIVIIGSIIANYVIKWINHELVIHNYGGSRYIAVGVKIVIYSIVFAIGLTQIGVGQSVIPTLVSAFSWSIAAAIGTAVAIGLGFTLKDLLPTAIAGTSGYRSVYKVGQKIRVGDMTGTITSSEVFHIIITNEKNESVVIPTKELMSKSVTILHSDSKN
ncbi:Putative small mechanosensitive channel [Nitrosotalea sinensis]|uniref:Small mechanosensitive channel n=1 Tax=Nitrosotalea sinensis TaxID=1499975 RepID=A0A2H1EH01_9ARCH|nr:Putative small mechanosensitive channel [Candidatus Nitrosotalea sinensis]